jgi:hypothetical protein
MSERFIDLVLDGRALWTDIDDYVDDWHESDSEAPLHEYLGLSWDEYSLWVEQPHSLRLIIAAREREKPVLEMIDQVDEYALAARGGMSDADARAVRKWLRDTGRLPRG